MCSRISIRGVCVGPSVGPQSIEKGTSSCPTGRVFFTYHLNGYHCSPGESRNDMYQTRHYRREEEVVEN